MKIQFNGNDSYEIQHLIYDSNNEEVRNVPVTITPEGDESSNPPLVTSLFDGDEHDEDSILETDKKKHSKEISEENIVIEYGKITEPLRKKMSVVSPTSFARLEGKLIALQSQLEAMSIHILPSDEVLLEETRKSSNDAEPIRDLLQSLNITKRMIGAEEGIDKLASLLETMAKEYASLKIIIDKLEEELGQNIVKTMMDIKSAAEYSRKIRPRIELFSKMPSKEIQISDKVSHEGSTHSKKSDGRQVRINHIKPQIYHYHPKRVKKRVVKMSKDRRVKRSKGLTEEENIGSEMAQTIKSCMKDHKVAEDKETSTFVEGLDSNPKMDQILKENTKLVRNVEFLNAEVNTLADYVDAIIMKLDIDEQTPPITKKVKKSNKKLIQDKLKKGGSEECNQTAIQLEERVACLELQFPNISQKIKHQLAAFCERINSISIRTNDLEDNIATIFKNLKVIIKFKGRNEGAYLKKILGLISSNAKKYNKITHEIEIMKSSLSNITNTDEKEANVIEECLHEVEKLKKIKADKFEIDEFLASKADCDLLKLKVSVDEFELVCNDFARGIEETFDRVATQEDTMKIIFNELYAVLNRKCDNEVIDQLREEFLDKLDNIKSELFHTPLKKSARLAAGTKEKLSPMNCISCDREVLTKSSIPPIPVLSELPPSTSIKPFIAYQLDQLRKLILKNPDQRSIFVFEEAVNRYRIKPVDPEENNIYVTGVRNRYCGGKHTTFKKKKLDCTSIREDIENDSGKQLYKGVEL
ncbi:uncharacterized protein isoform X4 [Rhodnius prolixus]